MIRFVLGLARREGRASRRRLALYMGSISLGVAALVAVNSFRHNLQRAIAAQARELLGADLELSSRRPFDSTVEALLDSLAAAGTPVSRVTSFASMALALPSGATRLVEVRAVEAGFPYYGKMETDPPAAWGALAAGRHAVVDPALLIQLRAAPGDTLAVGEARFEITGTVTQAPGDVALRSAIGPRVYLPGAYLQETRLLRTGSLARYLAFLKFDPPASVQRFLNRYHQLLRAHEVGYDTVSEREQELTDSLDALGRYLGLVGLAALLLGGVGVASAVNVFAKEKLDIAAILRCLGATQGTVFAVYLLQAGLLGLAGAALGAALGLGIQSQLPRLLADFLPVRVAAAAHWPSVAAGLAVGAWAAVAFALLPLLSIRNVSPLAALRRDYAPRARGWAPERLGAMAALGASLVALSVWQAPKPRSGFAFAIGVSLTAAVLAGSAWLLSRLTRRFFPARAGYVVRQGIANLFRPHNQTTAVTLAVGFGVFLMATLYVVQRNLLDQLRTDRRPDRPNLVLFDIQTDQIGGVLALLDDRGAPALEETPIVTARIAAINGRQVQELLADTAGPRPSRWALRREYRNTYRDHLTASEALVAGSWWSTPITPGAPWRISLERDLAAELGVRLGDRITWDVQGVRLETQVANLRRVNWARFEPNFFVVFEPAALEQAPRSFVVLTRVADAAARAELQRDLVLRYPNLQALDLSLVQRTLDTVLGSVTLAIRFMALFSLAGGVVVLFGAVAASRYQRMRESVLLRTLGASRRQIARITATEYLALGALAGCTGAGLAAGAGWALMRFFFEIPFQLPAGALAGLTLGAAALTALVGWLNSRPALDRAPLAVLREMGD